MVVAAVTVSTLVVGLAIGRIYDRAGFSFDGIVRGAALGDDDASLPAWLLALALSWLVVGLLPEGAAVDALAGPRPMGVLLGGLLAGFAVAVLAAEPLALLHGAGRGRAAAAGAAGFLGGAAAG